MREREREKQTARETAIPHMLVAECTFGECAGWVYM